MTNLDIAHQRLHNQYIASATFENPGDVVQWLGAVQAQDYLGALWAVGLRMQHATEADIEQAMADGVIVRTHPMRGTWHFVAAADIRWLLTLMAQRGYRWPGLLDEPNKSAFYRCSQPIYRGGVAHGLFAVSLR